VTGAEIARRSDSPVVRTVARSYAPLVATVVAGTGNHYILDAVAGAALGGVARRLA
jgi:PAP2 superfamily protein